VTGDVEGLPEAGFGFGWCRDGLPQQELALEPIRLRERVTPPAGVERRQGFGQQAQPLLNLADTSCRLGEEEQTEWR
jgi:hypothetical protein